MNYKSKIYFGTIISLMTLLFLLILFLFAFKTLNKSQISDKNILVTNVSLPDLSISTEAMYIRHRSLADIFSYFKESPSLLEYFPSTFVYHYPKNINNYPSKILHEK